MLEQTALSRRTLLKAGALAGGGLMLTAAMPMIAKSATTAGAGEAAACQDLRQFGTGAGLCRRAAVVY